jgi:hypothetical protein
MKYLIIAIALTFGFAVHADVLTGITVAPELDGNDYKRKTHFGGWKDADGDGQDTRQEVLADESLVPVTWSANGRKVTAGLWFDPFTRNTYTDPFVTKPSGYRYPIVQIDHIVPLKEAYESGAKNWTKAKRQKYANDLSNPGHLMAVHGPTNGAKGAKDPGEWLPPNKDFHCAYVQMWTRIKREWDLTMDAQEYAAIKTTLDGCP